VEFQVMKSELSQIKQNHAGNVRQIRQGPLIQASSLVTDPTMRWRTAINKIINLKDVLKLSTQ
jgi:hypothetical protein